MSFGRQILEAFAAHGDKVAMVNDRSQITYAQALTQVGHLAANFNASGIRPGDRVGLAMVDNIDVVLSILACWKNSATPVVIDFRTPRSQRARQARDFGLKMVFESRAMPGDEIYPNALFDTGWKSASAPGFEASAPMDDANPAFLIFSSGTTGDPKAYTQSHEALARRIAARRSVVEGTAKRFLTPMALSYSAMRHQTFGYLLYGGVVRFFPPLFTPSELIEALLSFQASGTALAPSVIARMVKETGERATHLLPKLSVLYSIGGPARGEDKIAAWRYISPGYRISYSSSLTGIISSLSGSDILAKPESAGRPVAGVQIEIVGPDGHVLQQGDRGLIKARTPTMASAVLMPGNRLFVDPQIMGSDWGIPGDIGFLDADGFVTIVDREADMIVRGGVSVAPQELEKLIRAHSKVQDVAVAGFADETMGQEIAVFIVSEQGTIEEFQAFLRANIAPDRRPREIRIVPSLPYSSNGKLLRRQLIETLARK
ncbi:class I adenylate-forming enzyme family protein [Mesorhizobium sp. B2-1-3A]|uniref:class I adenylate-forming enzyme family protein n=1 Tax=Mesorhizobium sp. B2-1-3A TaxID=2589971 RepID=UPI00112736E7|nr:class I adenylate-forming enzyme family protein [Mesorhizobium sp. B2-1-3A]TPM98299.1 acyl--CoA ligase [Mesorhizobium sp. B2-1-3A]